MENLSDRVIRSGLWMVALNLTGRLLAVVRLLALARLLTPHDFGLVGIALLVISLFEEFSASGMHLALIQRKERARDLFDTAWTLGVIRGGVTAWLLVVLAPAVGTFFDSPNAVTVVRVMALVPFMRGLNNIGMVEFRKDLRFGPYYLLHTSGVVADLCVAVPLALCAVSGNPQHLGGPGGRDLHLGDPLPFGSLVPGPVQAVHVTPCYATRHAAMASETHLNCLRTAFSKISG
jgi:O-antigen/teichoic acid export membrane protein